VPEAKRRHAPAPRHDERLWPRAIVTWSPTDGILANNALRSEGACFFARDRECNKRKDWGIQRRRNEMGANGQE